MALNCFLRLCYGSFVAASPSRILIIIPIVLQTISKAVFVRPNGAQKNMEINCDVYLGFRARLRRARAFFYLDYVIFCEFPPKT